MLRSPDRDLALLRAPIASPSHDPVPGGATGLQLPLIPLGFLAQILLAKQQKGSSVFGGSAEAALYLLKSEAYLLGAPC